MKRTEGERHAPQGRARTMTDEQEREARSRQRSTPWTRTLLAELDAERAAAHKEREARLQVSHELSEAGWATVADAVEDVAALKARLALAEAVCEEAGGTDWGQTYRPLVGALAAWRAAK